MDFVLFIGAVYLLGAVARFLVTNAEDSSAAIKDKLSAAATWPVWVYMLIKVWVSMR